MLTLQFKIHSTASFCYINRWNKLKKECEAGNAKDLAAEWTRNCRLKQTKTLPFINRGAGILGHPPKYIGFRATPNEWQKNDVFIIFHPIQTSYCNKWSLEELDDLRQAFQKVCNAYVKADLVRSYLKFGTTTISS